ncbi:RNA-binding protein [Alicyclobacillus sp. SO9]|uniref:YlmH family RNA-binding protein n=1 Tax=Alicyclobacillus sp. SO9 TaxID=2665646 RepID=UPI0018E8485C|nr:YlmH/Sll1252 family protein [Alicyclobacillus sp. SO9]QQE80719.1 hypothetical protein GI364_10190 [Alicyclobacillus sp. SO9]
MAEELHIDGWARAAERPFLRRLDDIALQVESRYTAELTDFLTPREQILAESMARHHNLNITFFGGYDGAERQRALIAPSYWVERQADYRICILSATLNQQRSASHRHIMGSLLGTGVKRKKVGDIGLNSEKAYVVMDTDLADFVQANWRLPGMFDGVIQRLDHVDAFPVSQYELTNGSVSSLRLDAVIAQFCKYSRSKAQEAVKRGHVTLNFAEVTNPAESLEQGDVISIRGFGRLKLMSLEGESKRGKQRLQIGVLKS